MTPLRRWALRVGIALLSLVATLLLAEAAYRLVKRARYRSLAASWTHELFVMQPGSDQVYVLQPDARGECRIGETGARWSYSTNSMGLRGPELAPPGAGRRRVLALGDSYTFGWAVEDAEPYPRVLEELLAEGPGGVRFEVVNAGTPGYNTVQQAAYLAEIWDRVRPDVVVLGFVMNDAEPPRSVPCPPDVLYGFSDSWLLEELKAVVNARFPPSATPFESLLFQRRDYREQFAPGRPEREACRAALEGIAARCRAADVPLHVFVLPDLSRPTGDGYPFRDIHATVLGWAAELDVPAVDLLDAFAGADHLDWAVPGDLHPNAAAHRVFAAEMARTLAAAGRR